MAEYFIYLFNSFGFSQELIIFIISIFPLIELRGAIPVAIGLFHMSPWLAFFLATISNIIIIPPILLFLKFFVRKLMKWSNFFNRFFEWLFARTRKKHTHKFELYGEIALILFVAVPLPLTGAWTGCLAAYLFGVPLKNSFALISIGVIIAGILVTLISTGAFSAIAWMKT